MKKNRIFDLNLKIIENIPLSKDYYLLSLLLDKKIFTSPGQFFELKVNKGNYPLLRRPLSILKQEDNSLYFLYKVIGEGTRILSTKCKGETVACLGPLGNIFQLDNDRNYILIGGGVGIPPLYYAARCLNTRIKFFYGARTKEELFFTDELKKRTELFISTDDGTEGFKGFITDLLKNKLPEDSNKNWIILTCGPELMIQKTAEIAKSYGIQCFGSLEERMACGYGICNGCPVKTVDGKFLLVCKDGPVFNLKEIVW